MINQLSRYTRHMVMLIILGVLLILVSRMGASSGGFLAAGIVSILLGAGLITLTIAAGRRRRG